MTKTKEEAVEELRALMPEGSTVYGVCRHRVASGMGADYSLVVFKDGQDLHPNYAVSIVLGRKLKDQRGYPCFRMPSCGYDRFAALVEELSQALYGKSSALRGRLL